MREWLAGRSFTGNVAVRSAVYAAIIVPTQFFQLGSIVVGQHLALSLRSFWIAIAYSIVCGVMLNLAIAVVSVIGARTFLNFISGRYHSHQALVIGDARSGSIATRSSQRKVRPCLFGRGSDQVVLQSHITQCVKKRT